MKNHKRQTVIKQWAANPKLPIQVRDSSDASWKDLSPDTEYRVKPETISEENTVHIGGTSSGGCNYLIRILKLAKHHSTVYVFINYGQYQDRVYKSVLKDLELLQDTCSIRFNVRVHKANYDLSTPH